MLRKSLRPGGSQVGRESGGYGPRSRGVGCPSRAPPSATAFGRSAPAFQCYCSRLRSGSRGWSSVGGARSPGVRAVPAVSRYPRGLRTSWGVFPGMLHSRPLSPQRDFVPGPRARGEAEGEGRSARAAGSGAEPNQRPESKHRRKETFLAPSVPLRLPKKIFLAFWFCFEC